MMENGTVLRNMMNKYNTSVNRKDSAKICNNNANKCRGSQICSHMGDCVMGMKTVHLEMMNISFH